MKAQRLRRKATSIPDSRGGHLRGRGPRYRLGRSLRRNAEIHYGGRIDERFSSNQSETFPGRSCLPAIPAQRPFLSTFEKEGERAFFGVGYGAAVGFSVTCASNNSIGSISRIARGAVISAGPFSYAAAITAGRASN